MNDAAADYQIAYDKAVHQYGENSPEALQAEREARDFFQSVDPMSLARLHEILSYEPSTGLFTWKVDRQRVRAGAIAGSPHPSGRIKIVISGRYYYAHRLAWLYMHGVWPKDQIDHINGDPSDNRIENLRDVSLTVNAQNRRHAQEEKRDSLPLGVQPTQGGWRARLSANGKNLSLGTFKTQAEAYQAYVEAKRVRHAGCTI